MSNAKLWLAYPEGSGRPEPAAAAAPAPGVSRSAGAGPGPEPDAGLRLIRAFVRIADASRRNWLVEEAERMSRT
jgi:hypothetical protein